MCDVRERGRKGDQTKKEKNKKRKRVEKRALCRGEGRTRERSKEAMR